MTDFLVIFVETWADTQKRRLLMLEHNNCILYTVQVLHMHHRADLIGHVNTRMNAIVEIHRKIIHDD
jgi:hypothetical protein